MATTAERLDALETELSGIKALLAPVMPYLEGAANGAPVKVTVDGMDVLIARVDDLEKLLKDGETIEELRELVAGAAPLSDFEALKALVEIHTETLAAETAQLIDGELATAELVEGPDLRGDLLKAFRQIETIAAHSNIRLPV